MIPTGKVLITQENHNIFRDSLLRLSRVQEKHLKSNKQHFMDKDNLVLTIIQALEECKRSKAVREANNTFLANLCFDEEWKMAKRNWKRT